MVSPLVSVIIPAFNEERAIEKCSTIYPAGLRKLSWSTMVYRRNGAVAQSRGATVVHEPTRGYGQACLRGLSALSTTDIVVFLDGDYSDFPEDMPNLYEPIATGAADLVIGSRVLDSAKRGLAAEARFGNLASTRLISWLFDVSFTDLGPFRAIDYMALERLEMCDRDFGWTVKCRSKLRG